MAYFLSSVLVIILSLAVSIIFSLTSYSTNNIGPWIIHCLSPRVKVEAGPPAIFIFGDSTSDVGTNNFIQNNVFRANAPHYGVDSETSMPSGRFSNGFITVDFVSQLIGFDRSPPPYLFLSNLRSDFLRRSFKGVNFASAGSGLLNTTHDEMKIVPMTEQVNSFVTVKSYLTTWMGKSTVDHLLSKTIFLVSIGSNDILDYINMKSTQPEKEFIVSLMTAYEYNIKQLYNLGARKFGMISVLPMGCNPAQRVLNETGGCLDIMNELAFDFYTALDALLIKISSELKNFKYSLGNTYHMTMNVIENPALYNFKIVDTACCGSGRFNAENYCISGATLCANRSEYAYFDGNHPTETAAELVARTLYSGELHYVSPINFSQLPADS
jgi:phospholipase/lecithinase/hemolysin